MATARVRRAAGRFRPREDLSTGGGYFFGGGGHGFSRVFEEASAPAPAVDAPETTAGREPPPPPSAASAAAARITPAVLFVTVMLAVVLLVSGLLHVLRRLFLKRHHAGAGAGDRLFFPGGGGGHDDGGAGGSRRGGGGLSQAAIDALPEFAYGELSGAANASSKKGKEKQPRPFDCAVCLCEFADHDRLRLLPACGHAFHLACIDVWLRSSATCPLCRTKLTPRHLAAANPDVEEQKQQHQEEEDDHQAPNEAPAATRSVVLPVRLGRFTSGDAEASTGNSSRIEAGRRSYSMGSYQYVLSDEHLLVSVHMRHYGNNAGGVAAAAAASGSDEQQQEAGKTKAFARGDSFSVSKIWQWRGSKRLPVSICADDGLLPWAPAAKQDQVGTHTRQQQHGDT